MLKMTRVLVLLLMVGLLLPALAQTPDLLAGPDIRDRSLEEGETVGKPTPKPPVYTPPPSTPSIPTPPPVTPPPPRAGGPVPLVRNASQHLASQFGSGALSPQWMGLGRVGGDMIVMDLLNGSNAPQTVEFVPGMVLDISQETGIQPVMLEEGWIYTLKPGETLHRTLRGYCLDQNRSAPPEGQVIAYTLMPDPNQYADCIKVLWAGLNLDANNRYKPILRPLAHRTVVIQRAIWATLAKNGQMDQARLEQDLKQDAEDQGRFLSDSTVHKLSEGIWRDVNNTLQEAAKSN